MAAIRNWLKHSLPVPEDDSAEIWHKELLNGHTPLQTLLEPSVLRMAEYIFQRFVSDDVTYAAHTIVDLFLSKVS